MSDLNSSPKTIDQTVLDQLWNFSDPQLSVERFRMASDDLEYSEEARAELATQLARALGLTGEYDDGDAVLNAIQSDSPIVAARIALERGRLRVAEGVPEEAVPLFTKAARDAVAGGVTFLALDAVHMLALTDAGQEEQWAADGLELVASAGQARTQRWGVALHNNLAWYLHDNGRAEEALPHFERALDFATSVGTAEQRFLARWAIARCLRTLGRTEEALQLQRALAAQRPDDRYVAAEIAALVAGSEEAPETVSEAAQEDVSEDAQEGVPEEAPEEASGDVSQAMTDVEPDEVSDDATESESTNATEIESETETETETEATSESVSGEEPAPEPEPGSGDAPKTVSEAKSTIEE
ncbi:tetratricopeptide repeat protein [Microterricola viridarii]|uniref:Tetratricopeptide repeat-containing protein n=1 Tax=Microterricola viridarii TaxID=412690 RepID=A0A0Y0MQX4_9MICO|nr:tetratricopeptide repeat protein [Microterricola viridarii]AMB58163.1 hypothetical protein AWU67_04035 [Microterricola viridarii]